MEREVYKGFKLVRYQFGDGSVVVYNAIGHAMSCKFESFELARNWLDSWG